MMKLPISDAVSDLIKVTAMIIPAHPHSVIFRNKLKLPDALAALPIKFILIALVLLLPALPASAATLTVSGTCTLAIAWASAVANSDQTGCTASGTYGDDTITLTGNVTINSATPLTLPTGNAGAVTITGNNNTYTVSHASGQHFLVQGQTLTINDLTLTGGRGGGGPGGAIEVTRFGRLNVNRSIFHGNSTTTDGGAISVDQGTVTIKQSVFYNNTATRAGGVIHSSGGALTLDNSTLYNNSSTTGQIQLGDSTVGEDARGAGTTVIRHITMAGCLGTIFFQLQWHQLQPRGHKHL